MDYKIGLMKLIVILFFGLVFIGCNNSNKDTVSAEKPTRPAMDPIVQKGLQAVAKSDCLTCHKVEEKFTGPAYAAVAARYPNNQQVIDSLAGKIIKGGSGNWGTIPMTPHPSVSEEDARLMVQYVLSLKK